jgi:hypothetical protein
MIRALRFSLPINRCLWAVSLVRSREWHISVTSPWHNFQKSVASALTDSQPFFRLFIHSKKIDFLGMSDAVDCKHFS